MVINSQTDIGRKTDRQTEKMKKNEEEDTNILKGNILNQRQTHRQKERKKERKRPHT